MIKAERKIKEEQQKHQHDIIKEIETGKLEQRLTPEETKDFIAAIAHEKAKMPQKK